MDSIYIALFSSYQPLKALYMSQLAPIHTRIHRPTAETCPRTLPHADCRGQGSNHRPPDKRMTALPPEPQWPMGKVCQNKTSALTERLFFCLSCKHAPVQQPFVLYSSCLSTPTAKGSYIMQSTGIGILGIFSCQRFKSVISYPCMADPTECVRA